MYRRQTAFYLEILTPSKLNLFLEVLAKRPDGFHELETVMVGISLYDSLFAATCPDGTLTLTCEWARGLSASETPPTDSPDVNSGANSVYGPLPLGADNIVMKAAQRFRERVGVVQGARLHLVKRIPAAAGLGGASSDAAAALVALNDLWRVGWSRAQLRDVAAEIGSDVPFFLSGDTSSVSAAICRGRGERIEPLAHWPQMHFVLVRPPVSLSTPHVFRHCQPATQARSCQNLLRAAQCGNRAAVGREFHNQLQPAAAQLSPWIDQLQHEFNQHDFLGHQMSGSGSTYFGLCRHARHARRLAGALQRRDGRAVFCASTTPAASRHSEANH